MVEHPRPQQPSPKKASAVPTAPAVGPDRIERCILFLPGDKVILDSHLADLYRVTVGRLNEAVKRNCPRFQSDFMFQLTAQAWSDLKSQVAISSSGWGGRRFSNSAAAGHAQRQRHAPAEGERSGPHVLTASTP